MVTGQGTIYRIEAYSPAWAGQGSVLSRPRKVCLALGGAPGPEMGGPGTTVAWTAACQAGFC